jgi:hypothetical protein
METGTMPAPDTAYFDAVTVVEEYRRIVERRDAEKTEPGRQEFASIAQRLRAR